MFWGIFITIIGVVVLVNSLFDIKLPLFRILFAVLLIYLGVHIFSGTKPDMNLIGDARATDHQAVFANSMFSYPPAQDRTFSHYSTIFGNSTLDLSNIPHPELINLHFYVIFGNSQIVIKKGTPLRIEAETIFGRTLALQRNIESFGKLSYADPSIRTDVPALTLKASVVFGQLKIAEE